MLHLRRKDTLNTQLIMEKAERVECYVDIQKTAVIYALLTVYTLNLIKLLNISQDEGWLHLYHFHCAVSAHLQLPRDGRYSSKKSKQRSG